MFFWDYELVVFLGLPLWIVLVFLFVLGTVIGSFLNVVIHRIPQKEELWASLKGLAHPPSRCPFCEKRILGRDNVPVLGWLILRGRCRFCKHQFSFRYPAIELMNGLLFVLVYLFEIPAGFGTTIADSCLYSGAYSPVGDWSSSLFSPEALLHWRYLYHMILIEALVAATFIDFDLRIIPDGVTVPAMAIGLLGGWALGQVYIVPLWFQKQDLFPLTNALFGIFDAQAPTWFTYILGTPDSPKVPLWIEAYPHTHGLLVSIAGLIVGGGIVWVVRLIGQWVLRQEAMGFGDVMLMAMVGSFLGWQAAVLVFFLAPLCALAVVAVMWFFCPQREIPYGPYLSLGALFVILAWNSVFTATERLFELGPLLIVLAAVMTVLLVLSLQMIQGVKWLLGFELYPPDELEVWTSADQLTYLAGECADPKQGRWKTENWGGEAAGNGSAHQETWKSGHQNGSWKQNWQRRNS